MIPFGKDTVTLIRRTEVTEDGKKRAEYKRLTLRNCSWRRASELRMNGNGLIPSETVTCRIPADQEKPRAGDLLILGNYTEAVTSAGEYKEIIDRLKPDGGAFMVETVSDNTRPGSPMPHWKAR